MNYYYIILFFGLLSTTIYAYTKILNIQNVNDNIKVLSIIFSLIMSIPLSFSPPLYELLFTGSTLIFLLLIFKDKFSKVLCGLFISIGIVLGVNTFFYYVTHDTIEYIENFLYEVVKNENFRYVLDNHDDAYQIFHTCIVSILATIFMFITIRFLFKINRLKKGFVFLQVNEARWTGIILSFMVMCSRSFGANIKINNESGILGDYYFFIMTSCIIIIVNIWWRYHTKTVYQLRINERTLNEQQMEIDKLAASNKFLSETVHRDNKLIPAMYSTLNHYLNDLNKNDHDTNNKGKFLLSELDELMKERKEKILKFNKENLRFPSTGLNRIDSIISYMHSNALEKNIELFVVSTGNIKELVEKHISKSSLETMISDLLENAIIATSYSENKKILLTMGMIDNCYEFEIKDSGIPFELKTLNNLGIRKATTHSDSGGSGIGYLKIFEILKEANASFILYEEENDKSLYTKAIKIRFDNKHNFIIHSKRKDYIKNPKMSKLVYNSI